MIVRIHTCAATGVVSLILASVKLFQHVQLISPCDVRIFQRVQVMYLAVYQVGYVRRALQCVARTDLASVYLPNVSHLFQGEAGGVPALLHDTSALMVPVEMHLVTVRLHPLHRLYVQKIKCAAPMVYVSATFLCVGIFQLV